MSEFVCVCMFVHLRKYKRLKAFPSFHRKMRTNTKSHCITSRWEMDPYLPRIRSRHTNTHTHSPSLSSSRNLTKMINKKNEGKKYIPT